MSGRPLRPSSCPALVPQSFGRALRAEWRDDVVDKMDQSKTMCPTIRRLPTKMFKEQEKRLITGLIGPM